MALILCANKSCHLRSTWRLSDPVWVACWPTTCVSMLAAQRTTLPGCTKNAQDVRAVSVTYLQLVACEWPHSASSEYIQHKPERLQSHQCFLSGIALISKSWYTHSANLGDLPGSEVKAKCAANTLRSQHEQHCYARWHNIAVSRAKSGLQVALHTTRVSTIN